MKRGTNIDCGPEGRRHLVEENRALLSANVAALVKLGVPLHDLVAVVGDLRDHVACALYRRCASHTEMDFEAERRRVELTPGTIPTMILVLRLADASRLLADTNPQVAEALSIAPHPECFRVVSISGGCSMLMHTRLVRLQGGGNA